MPTQRSGQRPVIQLLKAMGYKGNDAGMCYGLSHMMIQAILAGDLESAITRLDYIYQHSTDEIVTALNLAREEEKSMPKNPSFPMTIDEAEEIDQRRKLLEFSAFMEGVELYQQPYLHKEFFPWYGITNKPRGIKSASLTKPMRADDLYEVKRFAGVYVEKELESYFDNLRQISKNHAFAIELTSSNHSIAVAYDPSKGWYFIDANHSPMVIKVTEEKFKETMKTYVMEAFYFGKTNGYAAFSSTIYTNAADKQNTETMVSELDSRPEWQRIHVAGDTNKINAQDSDGTTLIYLYSMLGDVNEVKKLIDAGADINILNRYYKVTPLHMAIDYNDDTVVDALLDCDKVSVNSFDKRGYSPLSIAIGRGKGDLKHKLLQKGADPNYKNPENGNTALHTAIEKNDLYLMSELLLIGARGQIPNDMYVTPLMLAVRSGNRLAILHIFQLSRPSIDINQPHDNGHYTLLHYAATFRQLDICRTLISLGANVNAVDDSGFTPLLMAINPEPDCEKLVGLLLDNGADPNKADNQGNTALHLAALSGNIPCVLKLAYAKGIALTVKNNEGKTAADLASDPEIKQLLVNAADLASHSEIKQLLVNTEFLHVVAAGEVARANKLLQEGADINFQNPSDGNTALHIAIGKCDNNLIGMLLDKGARTDLFNTSMTTPLMHAARSGNVDAAKLLLERSKENIDVNNTTSGLSLMTALHFAAISSNDKDICEMLIKSGANVNAKTGGNDLLSGSTPLILKMRFGWRDKDSIDTIALLLNNNADANMVDQLGNTALHYAAENDYIRCTQLLLAAKGIALTVKNNEGKTAADLASDPEIKQLLVNAATQEKPAVNLTGAAKQGIFSTSPAADTDTPKPASLTPQQKREPH